MYKFKSSPYFKTIRKVENYTSLKMQCINLEKDLFNFINLIRKEPNKLIEHFENAQKNPNYNINFETQQIFDFINNLIENNISLPPLREKQVLNKISFELVNYLINVKKIEGVINYNNLEEEYINFRIRAAPYGRVRGKYYEAIVLDSTNLLEIISYIMKDIKGRNVLFNEKIKYIGISCGFYENINNRNNIYYNNITKNKICTIIDMVQDFEINHKRTNDNIDNNYNKMLIEKYKNKSPEIFMRIKTDFKDIDDEESFVNNRIEKKHSFDREIKKYHKLSREDTYDNLNKSTDTKKIVVNKSPLLNKKKYTKTYSNNFYLGKSYTNRIKPPLYSFQSNIKNQKFLNIYNDSNNIDNGTNNKYRNNSLYFSSQYNFNKNEKSNKKMITDNISEKQSNSSFSKNKMSKKKLNRQEKIELLKKINKASRDKTKKSKTNIKAEEDSKSVSFNTKKNISNDISFSEIISYDNDKKIKDEKEFKAILKNQIKNEIKKEMKEAKEEIKAELVNKMILSSNRYIKKNLPNLKIPINNNVNINETSYDFGIINNTNTNPSIDGKNVEANTNRSISSIDIFFQPNKNMQTMPGVVNYSQTNKSNNKNNIVKKLVKLYKVINKKDIVNKPIPNNNSFTRQNNIYYKIPIMNNSLYSNNRNNIYNNSYYYKKNNINNTQRNNNNKVINIGNKFENHNQNMVNYNSNSPKRRNIGPSFPFRKIVVKNNVNNAPKNNKKAYDKIIKIPKKIINYLDNNRIIINNKTNNIVYIKQLSPIRNAHYNKQNIYDNNPKINKLNLNNK